jgi:hypothetical protein
MRLSALLVLLAAGIAVGAFFGGRATVDRHPTAPVPGGYQAGREDAFGGFDGGWALGAPYAVTLKRGTGGITYAFARRWAMEPGLVYSVCGHAVCSRKGP